MGRWNPAVRAVCLAVCLAFARAAPAQDLVLTEIQASNDTVLADEDREYPDWVEIWNRGSGAVDLEGWALTDDRAQLDRWVFPARTILPDEFLVVFCSGKDRRDPGSELHANFRLDREGESIILSDPEGRVVSALADFPRQQTDVSYGWGLELSANELVPPASPARLLVPTDDELGLDWTEAGFDDSTWSQDPLPAGFDTSDESVFEPEIATDLDEVMRRENSSLYVRLPFTLGPEDVGKLFRLRVRYDDGFVAWVNGVEVAERNALSSRRYNARARNQRPDEEALLFEDVPLGTLAGVVQEGENLLAIQALNQSRNNGDFFFDVALDAVTIDGIDFSQPLFFESPLPGWPNGEGFAEVAPSPVFSQETGAFVEPFELELSTGGSGDAEIRFTTDGSRVTRASQLYTAPIAVESTATVRARVYQDGRLPSLPHVESYVFLTERMAETTSNLPIVIVNTSGRPIAGTSSRTRTPMHMHIVERDDDGQAAMLGTPQFSGVGEIQVRGSSTAGRPKASYRLEIQDAQREDLDVEILGMPAEADWILYGAYNFDRALMRNALIYELSNQVGRYAVRTRFCEVWVNTGRGPVRRSNYMGVYSFMENIKEGPDRVDVETLELWHDSEPEITGGYMAKIDRLDPGESGFTGGGQRMGHVYPKERDITARQRQWISNFYNRMASSLRNEEVVFDPERSLIDVGSWIDHHILNMLPMNVDAFRLSGYHFKTRGGPLEMGPIWDFDRSMGSTDGRDDNPRAWSGTGDGTKYFTYPWWSSLFGRQPPLGQTRFHRMYRARWRELRDGPLSTENIEAVIDRFAEEIGPAAARNFQKWRLGGPGFQGEINILKQWLRTRTDWIDSQFIEPPRFSEPGGDRSEPLDLVLTAEEGEVWYTVNGPDPKRSNGSPHPEAVPYDGPIRIEENTRIWARTRVGTRVWSEEVKETYVFDRLPLYITEIMYNPLEGEDAAFRSSDYEFLELYNGGSETISLDGVRFDDRRLRFDFSEGDVTELAPGGYVLLVNDREGMAERYGEGLPIAGELRIPLSNARMTVRLLGPLDEVFYEFEYDDDWHESTDGDGYSLVPVDPLGDPQALATADGWRPSSEVHGSPARRDGPAGTGRRLVGDANGDLRRNVTDAVTLLRHLFRGGSTLPCGTGTLDDEGNVQLLDIDGSGAVDLTDGVGLLDYLFLEGPPPAAGLGCVELPGCDDACPGA